jgi:hypothetical protein
VTTEPRPVIIMATPVQAETLWRRASYMAKSTGDADWQRIADELQAYYEPVAVPDPAPRVVTDEPRFTVEMQWKDR